tara:strand:- start:10050 stop:18845 length:8796 start_codon:yes stop_codon:yes gene_type:complete
MSSTDDQSFASYQNANYDAYLSQLGLDASQHSINSLEYDPITDTTNFSYNTIGTGGLDSDFSLDDFNVSFLDGDPLGLSTQHMGGDFGMDYYDPGMSGFSQDVMEGQEYWQTYDPNVGQEIQERINTNLMANAKTVVFVGPDGNYSGAYIGGNYFPANAYPGLGGFKLNGEGKGHFMPHMPLRKDRPPMATMSPSNRMALTGSMDINAPIDPNLEATDFGQNILQDFAKRRVKAELGQYYYGGSTPEEVNFFIQMYIRDYAVNELGIPPGDALTLLAEALDEGVLRDLPIVYDKDEQGVYDFETTVIENDEDYNFYTVSDASMKLAGSYREAAIAMGDDVYSEIPSNNVPSQYDVAIGARIYRTSEVDENGNYNYYVDKVENDPRLTEPQLRKIQESNTDIVSAPSFITAGQRQYAARSASDSLLLQPDQKDSFVNNVLQAAAAMTGDPLGEINKETLEKAIWSTATTTANPALGLMNIVSFVQDGVEALGGFLTGNKDFKVGPDVPDARDVLGMASDALGLDIMNNPYSFQLEKRQQQGIRSNYTNYYNKGLIDSDTYANLEKSYQDFLVGKGLGNNQAEVENILYSTNDVNALLNYEIEAYTPMQRSQKYLEIIEQEYIAGVVSDFQLLDAYNKHKKFISSGGNDGNGVTVEDANFVTGKSNPEYAELPISYDIDYSLNYALKLPSARTADEQLLFNEQQQVLDNINYENTNKELYQDYYQNKPAQAAVDPSLYTNDDGTINTEEYIKAEGVLLQEFYKTESRLNSGPGLKPVSLFEALFFYNNIVEDVDPSKVIDYEDKQLRDYITSSIDVLEESITKNTDLDLNDLKEGNVPSSFKVLPGRESLDVDEVMQTISHITNSDVVQINKYQTYNSETNTITDVASEDFTPIKTYSDQQLYIDNMGRLRDENTQQEVDPTANYTPQQREQYDQFIEDGVEPMQAMLNLANDVPFDVEFENMQQAELDVIRERIGTSDLTLTTNIESIKPIELPTAFQYSDVNVPILPESPLYDDSMSWDDIFPYATHRIRSGNENFLDPATNDYSISMGTQSRQYYTNQKEMVKKRIMNEINKLDYNYASSPEQVALAVMGVMQNLMNQGYIMSPQSLATYYDYDQRKHIPYYDDDFVAYLDYSEASNLIIELAANGLDGVKNDFGGYVVSDSTDEMTSTLEKVQKAAKINNIIFDNYNKQIIDQFNNEEYYSVAEQNDVGLTREDIKKLLIEEGKIFTFDYVVEDQDGIIYDWEEWRAHPITQNYIGLTGNGQIGNKTWEASNAGNVSEDGEITFNTTDTTSLERQDTFIHPLITEIKNNIGVNALTTELLNSIAELDKATIKLQDNLQAAESSRNELAQLAEERGVSINALITQIETLNSTISSNEQDAQAAAANLAAAEAEAEAKQQEIDSISAQITQIQSELDAESMRADTNQTLLDSNTRLLQQQVDYQLGLIQDKQLLEAQIQGYIEEAQEFEVIANGLVQDKQTLQTDLDAQTIANQELNTDLQEKEDEVLALKGDLETKTTELEQVKEQRNAKQAELDGVNKTLGDLRLLYNSQITDLEFKQRQIETVQAQRDAIQVQLDAEEEKYNNAVNSKTALELQLQEKQTAHDAAVAKLEEEKAAAVAQGEADVEATTTRLNEEKAAEIKQLRSDFASNLTARLNNLNLELSGEKAQALADAETAHQAALTSALEVAGTEAEAEKLAALKARSDELAIAQQAALDEQKVALGLEATQELTTRLQSQRLEIEGLAAEELANTKRDYDAQIIELNTNFETEKNNLQGQIDILTANELSLSNQVTTLTTDLGIAETNLDNKTQQYNAQLEINNTKQTIIDGLETDIGLISAENLKYIDDLAQMRINHQTDLDNEFNNYQTQLSERESQLTNQFTENLKTQKENLEAQAASDLAAEQARLEQVKQDELATAEATANQRLQDELQAARADEQLIASGNLAAREAELEAQYNADIAAAEATADANLQSELAAQEAANATNLATQIAQTQADLNAQHAAELTQVRGDLQIEYQNNLDAQTVSHNDQITQLNNTHSDALLAQEARLTQEKNDALAQAEATSTAQIENILSDHAIELTNAETEAQNRYDTKLEEELAKANADYDTALAAAEEVSNNYLNSETTRLESEKDAAVASITSSYESQIAATQQDFDTQIGALQDENEALAAQVEALTPPPPLYLGLNGEDYRVVSAEERAYLDNLTQEGLSGIANRVLELPSLYNYNGNVVYDPTGFNDEDLWQSNQIQELYYNGFPQTEEELVELLKANPDVFGEVNLDGSAKDAKDDLVQKIKDGIIDVGYALQTISGGTIGTTLLNITGIFLAGGIPLGNITNALGDLLGPDTAIELAQVLQRQINNRRNFADNKIVDWDEIMRIHLEELPTYDPTDFTDPNHPTNEDLENMATTNTTGPGGTNVTGSVTYDDTNLGDPTDYLYQILRIIEGPEVANEFRGKGLSDPEGFDLISKYLDQTTIDAAIRSNAIDEVALFGTDDQRGSIEIQGEAAQKIQDIAQSLREDQALSDIDLIKKYGSEAAEAIKGLDPDRLEQQSLLQELAKKRMQEALDFDPDVLPQEKLIGQAAESLLSDVRGESLIEKAVKTAALGQLDVNLTPEEAAIRERSLEYLTNAGKLTDIEQQEIKDNINTGLRARGRMDSDYGLMQQILGRTEAELDREDRDVTMGVGLYGEFDNIYGGRLARGATLGTAGESLTSARMNDNRANVAAGTELVGQLYNFENNRIEQQNAKDTMAANLQAEFDRQQAAMTGDVFGMLLSSLSTSPYGTTAISSVGGNIEAPTNLTNLIGMGSQDYSNAQTYNSTMEGLNALQQGTRDYMGFLTQGMQGYSQASQRGVNPMIPSISNAFSGFGDLDTAGKIGVIGNTIGQINDFRSSGGFTGDSNTSIIDAIGREGGITGDSNTNVISEFFKFFGGN